MTENQKTKQFDLEDRTWLFARDTRLFVQKLLKTIHNNEDGKQLIRSSGSVGTNYIEANESLSKKDFLMRIKISRKEVKESRYWLSLVGIREDCKLKEEQKRLIQEATEITMIFGAIVRKTESPSV